jgi:hypothetical protein
MSLTKDLHVRTLRLCCSPSFSCTLLCLNMQHYPMLLHPCHVPPPPRTITRQQVLICVHTHTPCCPPPPHPPSSAWALACRLQGPDGAL